MKNFTLFFLLAISSIPVFSQTQYTRLEINRYELVNRHNIEITEIDSLNSLTVGNGEFAFTADITGLQTFPEYYEKGIPLGTQSQWGWHSFPNPDNYSLDDVYKKYKVGNDSVDYIYQFFNSPDTRKNQASQWLRENPHRIHLGLIGLELYKKNGEMCKLSDIQNPRQQLNLWKGEITSYFEIEGVPVEVITYCHQDMDVVSFRITSELVSNKNLNVKLSFPYARHEKFSPAYDLKNEDKHFTTIIDSSSKNIVFKRILDDEKYICDMSWKGLMLVNKTDTHVYTFSPQNTNSIEFSCSFSEDMPVNIQPGFTETAQNNALRWKKFWNSGGAVDFSECTDPRAFELERRVILSQYLTKIQCAGSLPPQETGLTYNSWHGKFHLEMHWWHGIHFILWQRPELIEEQLNYYFNIFEQAKSTAGKQNYKGVRWPKMTGPEGRESPSTIGTFLIWQQPHLIYFAELLYRSSNEDIHVLNKYKDVVFATADFMASYAHPDSLTGKYILGPALIPAQERFAAETTINPSFELAYWYWALQTACKWRERLDMEENKEWIKVLDNISPLPQKEGLYLFTEDAKNSYQNPVYLTDHPMVLGILGFLPPTDLVDKTTMENTLDKIIDCWEWESIWGWDIPLAAMNSTCLNRPEKTIDFLLMDTPKNTYLKNGHNYQHEVLTLYLPGNGGLLTAIAHMCTYRDSKGNNGFPDNGKWNVKYENINKLHWAD